MSSRVLYVDATQGASGDMILGALVDVGVPLGRIKSALTSLPIDGWSVRSRKVVRCGLSVRKVDVRVGGKEPARGFKQLERIIKGGDLSPAVRDRAIEIFRRLIEAEAHVHGRPPDKVHLHEAGAVDAIVDIVGASVGFDALSVDRVLVSRMTTGFGEVRCSHGVYPVPAPATARLVHGFPVQGGEIEMERLTPTGAAVLTTVADDWTPLPAMRPLSVGYGAGDHESKDSPNVLRMILGEVESSSVGLPDAGGEVAVLECTMDDATPQVLAFAARRLFEVGALDVFTTAVTMKKGRSGHMLTVLADPVKAGEMARVVLEETSTLGLRFRIDRRVTLDREFKTVKTAHGRVRIKLGLSDGRVVRAWPEYDDCAAVAERHGIPLQDVQQAALAAYRSEGSGESRTRRRRK